MCYGAKTLQTEETGILLTTEKGQEVLSITIEKSGELLTGLL